jgi:hypothetical protein
VNESFATVVVVDRVPAEAPGHRVQADYSFCGIPVGDGLFESSQIRFHHRCLRREGSNRGLSSAVSEESEIALANVAAFAELPRRKGTTIE